MPKEVDTAKQELEKLKSEIVGQETIQILFRDISLNRLQKRRQEETVHREYMVRNKLRRNELNNRTKYMDQYANITGALTKWAETMNIAIAKAREEKTNAE